MDDDLKAELAELERLAKDATPGPWRKMAAAVRSQHNEGRHEVCIVDRQWGANREADNAAFIAAANPATILRLLSALRQRDEALESVRAERDLYRLVAVNQGWNWRLCDADGRDEYQKQREKHVDDCVAVAQSHAARAILTESETNAR